MDGLRRFSICFFALLALCLLLSVRGSAEESDGDYGDKLPGEYADYLDSLPEELADLLPPELFSSDSREVGEGVRQMSSFRYLFRQVTDLVGLRIGNCLSALASVLGLLLISAICSAVRSSIGSEDVGRAFSFLSTLAIFSALLLRCYETVRGVTGYFTKLNAMTSAVLPLMGALYAMGGNAGAAAASSAGLSLYMTVLEEVIGNSIVPFCGICLAVSTVGALDSSIRLGTLLSTLKKNYTTLLAFFMTLLIAMLAAQTTLGARADTLAMRGVKFAAGNLIPVVGGSVSELLRTVSAGVGYLRGTVGICAILLLMLLLLPTLVELFLWHLTWQIGASVAEILGCATEKKLLDEAASLCGYLLACVSICSSVLLLALTLLAHCASAIG